MAIADSNTFARPEIEPAITTLLKTPLGATHDLFQVLNQCQRYVDGLIENDNHVECMALCGRLLAGLNVLKFTLNSPLPEHLIESLTTDMAKTDDYRCPLSTDSETLREYCAALTMLLLNQQESADIESPENRVEQFYLFYLNAFVSDNHQDDLDSAQMCDFVANDT